jgi:ABC-2 type transport system permease protein
MIGIQAFSTFFVVQAIMERVGLINGWNFPQVVFLYGLGLISHGFEDMFFIQNRGIESCILRGEFDRLLLRPMGVFFQFNTATFNLVGFYDIIPGLIMFAYACRMLHFAFTPLNILYLLIITAAGTFIRGALLIVSGSVAFWTKKSQVLVDTDLVLMDRTTAYPLTMYPKWFQWLFTFVMPLAFITFYPVSGLLNISMGQGFPVAPDIIIFSPVAAVLFYLLAMMLFKYCMKYKYESSGT